MLRLGHCCQRTEIKMPRYKLISNEKAVIKKKRQK